MKNCRDYFPDCLGFITRESHRLHGITVHFVICFVIDCLQLVVSSNSIHYIVLADNNLQHTAILRKVVRKSAPDNPERYCGWFWVHCSLKKYERMAQKAMDVCLQMLKESNKCWSYPTLPFGVVMCTFFPTTFLEIAAVNKYSHCAKNNIHLIKKEKQEESIDENKCKSHSRIS